MILNVKNGTWDNRLLNLLPLDLDLILERSSNTNIFAEVVNRSLTIWCV